MDFLGDKIIIRFGIPAKIVIDHAKAFDSMALTSLCNKYVIILSHSSNYYPQGNDQVESSNKNIIKIISELLGNIIRIGIVRLSMPFGLIEQL